MSESQKEKHQNKKQEVYNIPVQQLIELAKQNPKWEDPNCHTIYINGVPVGKNRLHYCFMHNIKLAESAHLQYFLDDRGFADRDEYFKARTQASREKCPQYISYIKARQLNLDELIKLFEKGKRIVGKHKEVRIVFQDTSITERKVKGCIEHGLTLNEFDEKYPHCTFDQEGKIVALRGEDGKDKRSLLSVSKPYFTSGLWIKKWADGKYIIHVRRGFIYVVLKFNDGKLEYKKMPYLSSLNYDEMGKYAIDNTNSLGINKTKDELAKAGLKDYEVVIFEKIKEKITD